ncbi:cell wall-binding repeat-containing protein [Agrococcus sp. DT81.2]|uniref:cell wall-binding repeat-containing protein n=1 Tax=Agrococcus sp. DT81.2 TaxID=3393414 RepID=UPI003CE4701D
MRLLLSSLAIVGLVAVSLTASAPPASAAVTPSRIAGADRFATSVEISRQTPFAGDVVYLASGLSFPDALAAGPVAAAEGGHLLLTRPDAVDAAVMDRIAELAPREIVLVGSAATVRESVRTQLANAFPDTMIERIGGSDRVGTSLQLLDRLAESGDVSEIWVVSGWNFPDALVAASVAGATGGAVVLDWHGTDAASVRGWGDRIAPYVSGMPVSIAGGTPSVSSADEALLADLGAVDIVRHAGADRYDTARLINDAYPVDAGVRTMLLATGQNFPDALGGAALAASTGMPLYLSPKSCHPSITPMLGQEAGERGITSVFGLGSRATLEDEALLLEPCPQFSAAQRAMGDRWGTFPTTIHSGTGDAHIRLDTGRASIAMVEFTHVGTDAFELASYDTVDRRLESLIDGVGAYSGSVLADTSWSYDWDSIALDVRSTGSWTITVKDVRHLDELTDTAAGAHDAVFLYAGDDRAFDVSGAPAFDEGVRVGQWTWAVYQLQRSDLASLNHWTPHATGALQGVPSWVVVRADTPWEIALR